jgi:hypothetical protein
MALGSTRPLAEMSTRNLPGTDNLTAICEPIVQNSGSERGVRRESSKVARSSNKVAKLADYPVKCL